MKCRYTLDTDDCDGEILVYSETIRKIAVATLLAIGHEHQKIKK